MFLSVVILGRFTTETHAMARSITADTPDRYLHHTRGRTPVCLTTENAAIRMWWTPIHVCA